MSFLEMIENMTPMYNEAKERAKDKNSRAEGKKYGTGVSLLLYGSGLDGADSSEAWAEITPKWRIKVTAN